MIAPCGGSVAACLTVELRILGTLEVVDGGRSAGFARRKPRALLAALVINANQVVSADRLIDALWGECPPSSAPNTLQGYVSQVRQAFASLGSHRDDAPLIRTQAPGYVLVVDPEHIDARRFERLAAEARQAMAAFDPDEASRLFHEALSLWRGPALAEFVDEDFAFLEAARLGELRLAAIEDRADAELALGHHVDLVAELQRLVAEHPLRERLWGQLMLALYRAGRQADALRAFQTARRLLADELGIDPGPALRKIEADLLAQAPALNWAPSPGGNHQVKAGDPPGRSSRPGVAHEQLGFPRPLTMGASVGYVGRKQLLAYLADISGQALGGAFRAVFLTGEPGVGKTRTVAEVARVAHAQGAIVLYGRCDEDLAVPYQPFVEALGWYTTHTSAPQLGRHPAELTRLQPLLPSRVADLGSPVSSDPRSEEYLLFEATGSWLFELARAQPVVLVLDDLHWAPKPVVLLLRHLLRAATADAESIPMLVLGTYRDTEVGRDHPLTDLFAERHRLTALDRLTVTGLSPGEVEEFVSRAVELKLDTATTSLARNLHTQTAGNPFFLHEVLRHLTETCGGGGTEQQGVPVDAGRLHVPERVRDVVGGRIRRLSDPARRLLALGAMVGAEFDVELLGTVSGLTEDELVEALDEARKAQLIDETGADRYRFAHALVRATLVEELSATRRRRLHRRIGEAIEKLRSDDVVALTYHFMEAGPDDCDTSRAVRYGLAAAGQALQARALGDAEARFRDVLTLLDTSPHTPQKALAMCGLGEAQRDQGDPEYRRTLLDAARVAEDCGDVALLIRAALSNSRGLSSVIGGLDAERVAVTERALASIGREPSAARALLLSQLAAETTFLPDDRRRLALADEAEGMARQLGDDALLAQVLNRTCHASFSPTRVDRLVARGAEATELSDAIGDPVQRVLARHFWSGALLSAGDISTFRRVTMEMPKAAEQASPTYQWLALATQVRLRQIDGDIAGAQRLNEEAFERGQAIGEPDAPAWWTSTDAMLAWCQGRLTGPISIALRKGMELYPEEPTWVMGYAMTLAMAGRIDEARDVVRMGGRSPQELVRHVFPFLNPMICAVIAFHCDDVELACSVESVLGAHRGRWAHHYVGSAGPVSFPLALCAAVRGEIDAAVALCEEAEDALLRFGSHGLLPVIRTYFAQILLQERSPDVRTRAGGLLRLARRGAEALDAPLLLARIDALAATVSERSTTG